MFPLEHLHYRLECFVTDLAAIFRIGVAAQTCHYIGQRAMSRAEVAAAVRQHAHCRNAFSYHEGVVAKA